MNKEKITFHLTLKEHPRQISKFITYSLCFPFYSSGMHDVLLKSENKTVQFRNSNKKTLGLVV